jgi:hypothetical protein
MATQFILDLNVNYSTQLVIDDKDMLTLIDIMKRSKLVQNRYSDGVYTLCDKFSPHIKMMTDETIMTVAAFEEFKQMQATAEAAAKVDEPKATPEVR